MFTVENPIQNTVVVVPLEQLMPAIDNLFTQRIREKNKEDLQEKFLSPDKTRRMFHPEVSLVTLNSWAEKGLLNKHYIGGRTYYKYSEVIEAVKTLKRYSRKP
jgi:hypothetical protein